MANRYMKRCSTSLITREIQNTQEVKTRTAIWSSNPTSGYISKGNENRMILKKYLHSYVHCRTIHDSQDMETTYVSVNRWTDKDGVRYIKYIYIYIYMYIYVFPLEFYSAMRKKDILPFATTWVDLEGISEISQMEKDKYCMISLICKIY